MEVNEIIRLVEAVSESGLNEFDYEEGNIKIHLGKKQAKKMIVCETPEKFVTEAGQTSVKESEEEKTAPKGKEVVSPIVGIFYAAPGPDKAPFVKVGDTVREGQVIGIVEAMKLMNEIESDVSGVITEILVKDGDGVEYGQPLIRVEK